MLGAVAVVMIYSYATGYGFMTPARLSDLEYKMGRKLDGIL